MYHQLRHLPAAMLGAAIVAVVGAVVASALDGPTAAVGFALGATVVLLANTMSSFVVAWVDVTNRALILPIGLATYVVKLALVGLVVFSVNSSDWAGFMPMVWALALTVTGWILAQAVWTYRWARSENPYEASETIKSDPETSA